MTFCLNTTIIKPEDNYEVKNAIVLLHGYGGDGKDISLITYNWKRFLKNTIFLCPDAHEQCSINPNGYQWFDLSKDDPNYILEESLKAEEKVNKFIKEVQQKYNLDKSNICISGFSQGCMMSINVGLCSNEKFNSIIGFSGKIINQEDLKSRKKISTNTLLIHGDSDQIVPASSLLDAKDFFLRHKINIVTKLLQNCDHHIPIEASSLALDFIKKNIKK